MLLNWLKSKEFPKLEKGLHYCIKTNIILSVNIIDFIGISIRRCFFVGAREISPKTGIRAEIGLLSFT